MLGVVALGGYSLLTSLVAVYVPCCAMLCSILLFIASVVLAVKAEALFRELIGAEIFVLLVIRDSSFAY